MIKLAHLKPFAAGCKRECYVHPECKDKIIKIIPSDRSPEVLLSQKPWIRRVLQKPEAFDANLGESRKFEQLAKRYPDLNSTIPYLVQYFGKVQTDLGEGIVVQAIRNIDGTISQTVEDAAESDASQPLAYDKATLLNAIKPIESTRNDATIYNDVGENNIVIQKLNANPTSPKYKFWVIDGIDCRALVPITEYLGFYARIRKAKKLWQLKRYIKKNF